MYAQSQMIGSQIYYNLFGVRKNKFLNRIAKHLSKVNSIWLLQKEQDCCVMSEEI